MKFCEYCGSRVNDDALFCSNCGARQQKREENTNNKRTANDVPPIDFNFTRNNYYSNDRSIAIAILCFFFSWLGLVLWILWRDTRPGHAASAAKGALVSVSVSSPIVGIILWAFFKNANPEFSRVSKIGAIVGAVVWALYFILMFVLVSTGVVTNVWTEILPEIAPEFSNGANELFVKIKSFFR